MVSQMRYPCRVIQEKSSGNSNWDNLDDIKIENWQDVAFCDIDIDSKPNIIVASNFNFNIPPNAKINAIFIGFNYMKEASLRNIVLDSPVIKLNNEVSKKAFVEPECFPIDRVMTFNEDEIEFTPDELNDNNFNVSIEFPRYDGDNSGVLTFDYMYVRVEYQVEMYVLSTNETHVAFPTIENPLKKALGDEFKYTMFFRNSNGVGTERQEVKINLPEGIELSKYYFKGGKQDKLEFKVKSNYEDELDEENMIWYPSVKGKGVSSLKLILKCTSEGLKHLNAYNKFTGASKDFYVDVLPKGHDVPKHKFEENSIKWASELEETEEYQLLSKELAIKIDNVSMEFDMPQEKVDNLKEYCIKWLKRDLKPKTHFKALDNISFEINKGERVGIIGFNGAGKSTLLKVLAGVYKPTKGKTFIDGKVAPLLELGAGFDHNYSGRENVFLNGAILGYSRGFLESKYDEIVEFSELGDFMEIPIKNYSSGMNAKLGFAVATVVNPEILILDEILSVGDVKFQKKSGNKLKEMMGSGTTVLLVSHSTAKIRELCTRVIWLDKGKLVMDGDVDYVCDAYIEAAKKASEDELKDLELV